MERSSRRLSVSFRGLGAFATLWVAFAAWPGVSAGAIVVINNGLAPPELTNVVSGGTQSNDQVNVRNVGCPPAWPAGLAAAACPSPGSPTFVEIAAGAQVSSVRTYDTSIAIFEGGSAIIVTTNDASGLSVGSGTISFLTAGGASWVDFSSGTLAGSLLCSNQVRILIRGGSIGGPTQALGDCQIEITGGTYVSALEAYNDAVIQLYGSNFQLDGVPQPFGVLAGTSGTLTGSLASGDNISVSVLHNGYDGLLTGSIVLKNQAVPALGPILGGVCAALLALIGAAWRPGRRFVREQGGLEMVEWAVVASLIVAGAAATFYSLPGAVNTLLVRVFAALNL